MANAAAQCGRGAVSCGESETEKACRVVFVMRWQRHLHAAQHFAQRGYLGSSGATRFISSADGSVAVLALPPLKPSPISSLQRQVTCALRR